MADKNRLIYEDYRPLRKGEPGYSKSKRLLVSPSTGEIITRRQFIKNATKTSNIPQAKTPTPSKPRKQRADKGMTRADYELVKAHKQAVEAERKRRAKLEQAVKAVKSNKIDSKETGLSRFEQAREVYIHKQNIIRKANDEPLLDENVDMGDDFFGVYDVLKHPNDYSEEDLYDAIDYFSDDDYTYDFPLGETP